MSHLTHFEAKPGIAGWVVRQMSENRFRVYSCLYNTYEYINSMNLTYYWWNALHLHPLLLVDVMYVCFVISSCFALSVYVINVCLLKTSCIYPQVYQPPWKQNVNVLPRFHRVCLFTYSEAPLPFDIEFSNFGKTLMIWLFENVFIFKFLNKSFLVELIPF